MNIIKIISIFILYMFVNNCAQTSIVMLDESLNFEPSENVRIIEYIPEEPFVIIAKLETRGTVGQSIPTLLTQMRNEAKVIGADAIIPIEEKHIKQQQGIMYNPWLGGYQSIGGGNVPVISSYAIIFEKSIKNRTSHVVRKRNIEMGGSFNLLPLTLAGVGISGWVGKDRYRITFDHYNLNTPASMLRDGFIDGKVEEANSIGLDYFYSGRLSGVYFGGGIQFADYSVGHENTFERGSWGSVSLNGSLGYLYNISNSIFLDTKITVNASLAEEEAIYVGNYEFVPDTGSLYGLVGIGIKF
jgi:hypothetical protein